MTEREKIEREIILDILAESSKWRISEEDQTDDCIRLEVMDRARRLLLGTETIDENGYAQSHPGNLPTEDDEPAEEPSEEPAKPARRMNAAQRYRTTHVRVNENGKPTWHRKDECRQVPVDGIPGKFRWVWDGPKEPVDKLSDELWAEHEAEN